MALLWNDRSVVGPPIYTKQHDPFNLNLSALRQLFESMVTTYTTTTFDETAALTSRLIARRVNSFRSQAGFKALRKTNIALCRLKDINIVGVVENFLGTLPDYIVDGAMLSLPTYENFQFVMLRLQSLSKLLLRIAVCARESSALFRDMIQRNFFIEISALYIALLAQIWDVAKRLSIKTRDFYNSLYPYRKYFPLKSKSTMDGTTVVLSNKLESFLTSEWTNEFFNQSLDHSQFGKREKDLGIDFGDFDDDGESILTLREDKTKATLVIELKKVIPEGQDVQIVETKNEPTRSDFGVAISRDTLEEVVNVDQIVRTEEISKLINEEQSLRDKKRSKRTRHLNDSQWKDVKAKVRNILVTSHGKMCIKKFKSLWKSVSK
ncbi:uncharacterized protein LOC119071135 [Bradysia coprophila]|uniref:uncharacterized protein LOC119071135 n=1 Tax=Bradysia coprophila TaxID=38358 RepID=UPI00187DCD2C|nr:uncharacterized protein LOC119071135 [Bradysia coprophila]